MVGMQSTGMALAALAVFAFLVFDLIALAKGLRDGICGVDGWGTARRKSEPVRFWAFMVFHVGVAIALVTLLVAAAKSLFP
jgi:hypothetical protein